MAKAKIELIGKNRIVEGVAGVCVVESLKELMHLAHIQITGEIPVAWCSSPSIVAGPAHEGLYMFDN